jgi:hypothetical protein
VHCNAELNHRKWSGITARVHSARQRVRVLTSVHRNLRSGSLEAPVLWRAIGPDFRLTGLTIENRNQLPKAIQRFLAALDSIDCRMSSFGPAACEWCVCFVLNRIVSDMRCGPFAFLYNLSEGPCAVLTSRQIQIKPEVCRPGCLYSSPGLYFSHPAAQHQCVVPCPYTERPYLVGCRFCQYGPSCSAILLTIEACLVFPSPAFPAPPVKELDDKIAQSAQMESAAEPVDG